MASTTRTFARLARPLSSSAKPLSRSLPRQTIRQTRRGYASGPFSSSSSNTLLYSALGLAAAGGAGYYLYATNAGDIQSRMDGGQPKVEAAGRKAGEKTGIVFTPKQEDYQKVYDAVAKRLEEHDEYDDGSYGPVLLRLGWHASGTYDKETNTGGSNGATMRFAPEGDHGANAGLKAARDFLEPVKQQFPWISYSDLWTLAAVCAIQELHGPVVPWRPGRADRDASWCTPDGRLPDGSKDQTHLRAIFGRMGFNDQEIVALSGAHALGRCHTDRSGFEGPWTFSPTVVTNDYYKLLLEQKWGYREWDGPRQFQDQSTKSLMMLPTDLALTRDRSFMQYVQKYARDNASFFEDFSKVLCKLFELGVPFQVPEEERFRFTPRSTA